MVLAVGMEPSVDRRQDMPGDIVADSSAASSRHQRDRSGMFGAGCATNALDVNRAVQSATAAALRAIQVINKAARAEA